MRGVFFVENIILFVEKSDAAEAVFTVAQTFAVFAEVAVVEADRVNALVAFVALRAKHHSVAVVALF